MQADVVILCGGLGTRLRPAVSDRPKPMTDVGGKPFLERLVDWAEGQGFARFILCVGHKAGMIREHFRSSPGREILFSEETSPLGTGGALKLCRPLLASKTSLVLNGDSYCAVDLRALLRAHEERSAAATVAAVAADGREDGGRISAGPDGRVLEFAEKAPARGAAMLNAGVYALDEKTIDLIGDGPSSLERDLFPRLLPRLFVFRANAPLYDIGTPERLEAFRKAVAGA